MHKRFLLEAFFTKQSLIKLVENNKTKVLYYYYNNLLLATKEVSQVLRQIVIELVADNGILSYDTELTL